MIRFKKSSHLPLCRKKNKNKKYSSYKKIIKNATETKKTKSYYQ